MATFMTHAKANHILKGILNISSLTGTTTSGLHIHALTTNTGTSPGVFNGTGTSLTVAQFKTAVSITDTVAAATIGFTFPASPTAFSVSNSGNSGTITIGAGKTVWYILLADGSATSAKVLGYIRLTNPANNYKYDVAGTLRINSGSYTISLSGLTLLT